MDDPIRGHRRPRHLLRASRPSAPPRSAISPYIMMANKLTTSASSNRTRPSSRRRSTAASAAPRSAPSPARSATAAPSPRHGRRRRRNRNRPRSDRENKLEQEPGGRRAVAAGRGGAVRSPVYRRDSAHPRRPGADGAAPSRDRSQERFLPVRRSARGRERALLERVDRSRYGIGHVPSASEALAEFAAGLRYDDLPGAGDRGGEAPSARRRRRRAGLVADAVRAHGAAGGDSAGRAGRRLDHRLSRPPAAGVVGAGQRHPGARHRLRRHARGRRSCTSAAASPRRRSPPPRRAAPPARAFSPPLVLGMETAVRLGLAAPGRFHDRGFHPTGVCGAFATALVAGSLAGLPARDARRRPRPERQHGVRARWSFSPTAPGRSASTPAGRRTAAWSPRAWPRPASPVRAPCSTAASASTAAISARTAGIATRVTRDLGRRWHMLDIALKPYPCCHMTHAFIDCAASLRGEPGVDARRDRRGSNASSTRARCRSSASRAPPSCVPQTDYDAKFSLPYTVACMLVRGHVDVDDFTPRSDPRSRGARAGAPRRLPCPIPTPTTRAPSPAACA